MNNTPFSVSPAAPIGDSTRRGASATGAMLVEPSVSYVICTNPRSGSWLLAEGLEATGVAGRPQEWFHEATAQELCQRAGLSGPAEAGGERYLAAVKQAGQTANGVFGLKLHYYQFDELLTKLRLLPGCAELSRAQRFAAAFGQVKYLWLTRRDKARQAVSYHRACQTDGWWQKDGEEPPRRPGTVAVATFDAHAIERLENLLMANEQGWQRFFDEAATEPLVLHYEDLAADYEREIRRVLAWLGVTNAASVAVPPPTLKKQADAISEEWVERYLRFKSPGESSPVGRPDRPSFVADGLASRPTKLQDGLAGRPTELQDGPAGRPTEGIGDDWKRWIGENKLLGSTDESIIDVLTKNGSDRNAAAAEVARATGNPYLAAGDWYVQRLKKAYSLLGVYRELAKLRPCGSQPSEQDGSPHAEREGDHDGIERRPRLSRQEFLEEYYGANRPVLLEGLMDDWPAMRRWTPDYLKTLLGDEEVEIMAGRANDAHYEINCQDHRRKMRFGQYVDLVHSGNRTNDYYLVANNGFLRRPKPRRLLADIVMFDEYLDPRRADGGVFFWYGPAGTVTPLHHDTSNIFMAQVRGRKRVKLISPNDLEFLYNDLGVYSPVDCDAPDLARWPRFANVEVREVVLGPGEVLFIPVGWWHHVRALDVSITVSLTNFVFANHYEWSMPQIRK